MLMKKSKWLAITGLTVVSTLILAACGSSSASNTYSYVYIADLDTLDYVNSNRATTSDVTSNLVDGLLENDKYGNLVPFIAEDWTVSKDDLTYTDRKSTRLNSSHHRISYAVFCLKKKKNS